MLVSTIQLNAQQCQEPCPLKGTGLQRWGGFCLSSRASSPDQTRVSSTQSGYNQPGASYLTEEIRYVGVRGQPQVCLRCSIKHRYKGERSVLHAKPSDKFV